MLPPILDQRVWVLSPSAPGHHQGMTLADLQGQGHQLRARPGGRQRI